MARRFIAHCKINQEESSEGLQVLDCSSKRIEGDKQFIGTHKIGIETDTGRKIIMEENADDESSELLIRRIKRRR